MEFIGDEMGVDTKVFEKAKGVDGHVGVAELDHPTRQQRSQTHTSAPATRRRKVVSSIRR